MSTRQSFRVVAVAVALASLSGACAAAGKCSLVKIEEWPIRLVRNHLIVDGSINGARAGVLLDTGATRSLVMRSAATRFNLPRQEARGYRVFGIGGESKVEVASIDDLKIGDASRKGWKVLIAGEQDFGEGVDFVLGEDFFRSVDVEFDLANRMVRLFQPVGCEGTPLAYWTTKTAGVVDFERVTDATPQIMFTVQINGKPVQSLLDSGAAASTMTTRDAALAGVTPDTPGVAVMGNTRGVGPNKVEYWVGPFATFGIGTEVIRDARIFFADMYKGATVRSYGSMVPQNAMQDQPMLLGVDFLRAHRVLVAHSQRKIYFTYLGGPVFQMDKRADEKGPKADEKSRTDDDKSSR